MNEHNNLQKAKAAVAEAKRLAADSHEKVLDAIEDSEALAVSINEIETTLTAANTAHVAELAKAALGEPNDIKVASAELEHAKAAATDLPALRKQLEVAEAIRVTLSARHVAANAEYQQAVEKLNEEINDALRQLINDKLAEAEALANRMESVSVETAAIRAMLTDRGERVITEPVNLNRIAMISNQQIFQARRKLESEYGID